MEIRARIARGTLAAIAAGFFLAGLSAEGFAQPAGNNNNNINVSAGPAGGIIVDAKGILDLVPMPDGSTELIRTKATAMRAAAKDFGAKDDRGNVVRGSAMRMISLTRLEKAIAAKLEKGERLDDEMLNLAGL
ncbi:MAG: hypothetical protein WD875_13895, partial [Pirellulales bacterium]